jgi:Tol biopolymer transport system component
MRGLVVLLAVVIAAALPGDAAAQGALAFTSIRCDDGGVPTTGSWPGFAERPCTRGVFVMDDDGANQRRLTTGHSEGQEPRSGDLSPSWSPAGDRIVFGRQSGGAEERLFVMNANGSGQRQLIPGGVPGSSGEQFPSWSRTGDLIAFFAYGTHIGFGSIWVVRPDGSGLRRVSPVGQTAHHPTIAPDGKHIVYFGYSAQGNGSDSGMWVTDRDGAPPRRVTAGDQRISSNGVSFSPSGRWMAVTLSDGLIYAMRTDGSELRRIEGAVGTSPTWSGLGNAIFYTGGTDVQSISIYRLDLKPGATPKALTAPGTSGGRADWSAAGRFTSLIPPLDELAPLTLVGDLPGTTGRLPFLAVDASGLKRVDAAVGLRSAGRCRFLRSDGKLGARRSCGDPVYAKAPLDGPGWRKRTKSLPKGTYEVRIRATDARGNTTRKPKRRVVKVG